MKPTLRWLPASLARRFALAAAGLAVAALAITTLVSLWLINQQHHGAERELAARDTRFRAESVGSDLAALASRMSEIANSTILATGLVDSAGRETYLAPYLHGVRQINGIPVQVMLTDFEGVEIASNGAAAFSPAQLEWLRSHIDAGVPASQLFQGSGGDEVVALEPMIYARTSSPEGAIFYKFSLMDLEVGNAMSIASGAGAAAAAATSWPPSIEVPVPVVYEPLQLRVRASESKTELPELSVPYLHIVLITLALFGIVVWAGVRLARLLTRDLRALESFSGRLVGTDLATERAPETGSVEVASLARSINDMLERLDHQRADLIAEREKLTRLTEALQSADRRKDEFLAMLGHELRNPLAPISTGAQLLRRIPGTDPRVIRTSEVIVRQVGQMTKIVSDLLDVSRVTRGLITLERTEVDMADVVRGGIEQVRPLIDAQEHILSVVLPETPLLVHGDHARLVQVVSNLVTNAAKYTHARGRIAVRCTASTDEVTVSVEDNGVGIAPDLMPQLFELFTQGSRDIDRSQGGLGLGLALVRHLVKLHGGSVEATSDGAGQGSVFTLRLPRVVQQTDGAVAPTADALRADPMPQAAPYAQAPAASAAADGDRLRILVVDDNLDAAETLAQWLILEGHQVAVVPEAGAALAHAISRRSDVYILDIGLPGMDGLELARRLRATINAADALLIALTGYGQADDRRKSAQAGFDHHLVKPTDPATLRELLRNVRPEPADGR